ncbi:RNA polymerase sigma factor [Iamia sp. SCSIO 61187]|uniref:RNA polymerase sigma factor n=1 Tax=Iamia sp. SCSIO 61187 TaxID=2722752 RepID=UPI001C63AB6C|nr:sigma-70 family RNA polymerase sigma factor [Iamia sp. SCSIO 61187]
MAEVFRHEAGPAVATVARLTGDIGRAEDAVQEAFAVALRRWPTQGVPDRPGAWITTTARNRALDVLRREATRPRREEAAARDAVTSLEATPPILHPVVDDQLRLVFTCCHPALPRDAHVELTLRLVCGLRVPEIARALLRGEEAVGKRIQRAKAKIRDAAIPLRVPPPELLTERLPSVLACTYLTFTEGYAATAGDDLIRHELCDEGVRLARLLVDLLPGRPGAEALLALLLLQDARRPARLDAAGEVVVLADQDRSAWDRGRIDEGMRWMERAADHPELSAGDAAYLFQAAVAAEHSSAPTWEATDWPAIVGHYDRLAEVSPSPAVRLNRAVAVSYADGPAVALPLLDALADDARLARSHRLALARADVHRRLGAAAEARAAYREALALGPTAPEARLIRRHLADL